MYGATVETKGKRRRTVIARRMHSLTMLLLVVSITGQGAYADPQEGRLVPWRIERDIQRFRTVATDDVMKLLAIKPGMVLLDIGAGTGQFAYEFAGRLNGTGEVFATDANEYCIEYMKKEAAGRGLRNLHPVLVKKDGVDPFYGKHRYDLITVFHISMAFEDQAEYFRELRGFLAPGGRLVLILYKIPTPFSSEDFTGNFGGFVEELSLEPAESPYYRILKDTTRIRIREHPGATPTGELKGAIVEDLNEMLSDTRFAARFSGGSAYRKGAGFSPEERRYADWFLLPFSDNGIRGAETRIETATGARAFATINKLLVTQRFRKYFRKEGLFVSGFTPSIKAAFEKAGYKLEREYSDLIPFEDLIVFSSP
jgi:SAM-dependent methyltransferase